MMRFYKLISTSSEMQALQSEAHKHGKNAVGFSSSGLLYKFDASQRKAVSINEFEAADLLETTVENVRKIVESKGDHVIEDDIQELEVKEELLEDVKSQENGILLKPTESEPIKENEEVAKFKEELRVKDETVLQLKQELDRLKEENNKLIFENAELEVKANKKPSMTLEDAIAFVKRNGYELRIK